MKQNAIGISIPIEVDNGGIETTTLTDHGVLIGSGVAAITALGVASTGTVLQGSTAADPAFTATPTVTSINFGDDSLANYKKGTWTPALTFGGGSTGITYGTQVGSYTRIGRIVYCFMNLILTNKGSDTGVAVISGLPFSAANGFEALGRAANIDLLSTERTIVLENSTGSTMSFVATGDNIAPHALTDAEFVNTSAFTTNFGYNV